MSRAAGPSYEATPVAVGASYGLDLETLRDANKFELMISKGGVGSEKLYSAYTDTRYNRNATVGFGSHSQWLSDTLSSAMNGLGRAMWQGIGEKVTGRPLSVLWDGPVNPYVTQMGRWSGTFNTILPLDPVEGFANSILRPIQALYEVTLPQEADQNYANDIFKKGEKWVGSAAEFIEGDHRDDIFFTGAAGGMIGFRELFKDARMLNNPLQAGVDVDITAVIGSMRYPSVLITGINVEFGENVFIDSNNHPLPSHAKVTISLQSKYRDRADTLFFEDASQPITNTLLP